VLDLAHRTLPGRQAVDQIGHAEEVLGPEQASTAAGLPEGIRRSHAGSPKRNPMQSLPPVRKVDPVFAPGVLLRNRLKLATEERVERMRHSDTRMLSLRIGCSRLLVPIPSWKG